MAVLSLFCTVLVTGGTAQATGVLGCTGAYPISSCASRTGNYVYGDFYMNASLDTSRYYYWMEIQTTTHGSRSTSLTRLNHTGRFNPLSSGINIASQPWKNGSVVTVVHVYDINYNPHGVYTSPRVYY
ncbi:hypothetical protein ACIBCT_30115 [Streptosporangium sp. NPDC050855]|uniref:hypothetical protein n=1 Tax=Streptosporangium sp. NPDC050855 TaxID=3366194 RepID=UPI0037959173